MMSAPSWRSGAGGDDRMGSRLTRVGAVGGLVLALAAAVGLALWPCMYRGAEGGTGVGPERQFCASLVEVNGAGVLAVLAFPVLLAGIGVLAVRFGRRGLLMVATGALIGFCVVALSSIGLFYLPATVALVVALVGWGQPAGEAARSSPPPRRGGPPRGGS
jgi:hypothetical protein